MKKIIIWILVLLSILMLVIRFSGKGAEIIFGIKQRSGISVLSNPEGAKVFLDEKEVGVTPYENKDLEVKEYTVRIEKDKTSWQGKIRLTSGTVSVVNRDLSASASSSAGEVLILEKGRGLTIVSNPADAGIEIDGKVLGKTPLTINLEPGEHTILLSHPSYLKRSIRASLPQDFNLNMSVDLALSEADLTTVNTPTIKVTPEVVVKDTPVGFLRVRDKASTSGREIAQVKPGDTLTLLEELSGWVRVRLPDNTEGFVSSTYVEKKTTE